MKMQQRAQQGFTLIELMIVIAIVGILAAIALPAYQDYTVRAKMSEPLAALSEAKTTLSEYYVTNNAFPPNTTIGGVNTDPDKSIVASLKYATAASDEAIVTATLQDNIIPGGSGTVYGFSLSSITKSDGSVQWTCKRTSPAGGASAIDAKYLPANCRT